MDNDEMKRFFLTGLQELRDSWPPFDEVEIFEHEGWCKLIAKDNQAELTANGFLRHRLLGKKVQLDSLLYRRSQGQLRTLPEHSRMIYEDLKSEDEADEEETYRLFQTTGGSSWIYLKGSDTTMDIQKQVAEYLALPSDDMAMVRMSKPTRETSHWIFAGEIPTRYNVALVLVDTALPEAYWMPTRLHWQDLRSTWSPHHAAEPDIATINDVQIYTWPTLVESGDLIKLRWDGHSEAENAKDLDIFKKIEKMGTPPPTPPDDEGGESSPGGMDDDDDDPQDGEHNPAPPLPPTLPATTPFEVTVDDTPPGPGESSTGGAPHGEEGDGPPTTATQKENMTDPPSPRRWNRRWGSNKAMEKALHEDIPLTINYAPTRPTTTRHAVYVEFQGQILPCDNGDPRTLEQVVQDEWGLPPDTVFFLLQGRWIGAGTTCSRIPTGHTGATAKLRGLFKQKGVPEELLDERIEEIKSQVGERGIKEAYSSFDPWSHLKAACSKRLVKEAESRNKPKAKVLQPDDDPLQTNDPWSMALQERSQWSPEATFFKTEAGTHPSTIAKITHGATGVALVTEREAEILLQNQDYMSTEELAALVVGTAFGATGKFPIQEVEIPCRNQDDRRILLKAQMINLGAKQISLFGEDSKIKVDELDGIILAAEIIRKEVPQWEEVLEGPLKYIKKQIPTLEEATFASWGRKFFLQGKPTTDTKNAETCFILLRIKRDYRDATLRTMAQGIYIAPRSADNGADPSFKVVWFADRPTSELAVLANSEPQAFGLVRSKSGYGIRVKVDDFSRLKQQKWQPGWQPLADTPYHLMMNRYFEVQNLPLSCSKVEVQKFLNQISWKSLAIRQLQPRTWLVGAEQPPPNHVDHAAHGTVLISEKNGKGSSKGKAKGSGKSKGKMAPWILAGTPTTFQGQYPATASRTTSMDNDQTANDLEDRIQKRMDQLHAEQKSAHAILKEDFKSFQEAVQTQTAKQETINLKLQQGLVDITTTITSQLNQNASMIASALQQNRQEINKDIMSAQVSLKEELMGEGKDQMSHLRKRTPSPQRSGEADDSKKQRA